MGWTVWGCPFFLTEQVPKRQPLGPFTFQVPFMEMSYREEEQVGHLEFLVKEAPIEDDALDQLLEELRRVLVNLARRPEMVLLLRTDARRASSMPAMRHVRKFLSFIQKEVGTECVLVGRGSAIVLVPSTLLGRAVLRLVQFVQRMLPAPYPQAIVANLAPASERKGASGRRPPGGLVDAGLGLVGNGFPAISLDFWLFGV
ncbi:unnamed protein product [Effrenium voratum]|uniref:Uncharacterized protein n=1 Tax=Effrenium voratum TaxID=2562239 RepID=A0AA36NF77_9DINO|nr:unnamed protein product [Effrenium voratum]